MTRKAIVKAGHNQISADARRADFIEAFITNGGNATQAAITAGYSAKTAQPAASRLLSNVIVKQAINARLAKVAAITGLTTERTLQEVARIAYSDPRKLFAHDGTLRPVREWDDDTAAFVASVESEQSKTVVRDSQEIEESGKVNKLKLWDKNAALVSAMKFAGLFREDNAQRGEPVTIIEVEYV